MLERREQLRDRANFGAAFVHAQGNVIYSKKGRILSDNYARAGGFASERLGQQVQASAVNGQGERAHSDASVRNQMFDAEWLPSDTTEIKAGLQRYTTRNELPGALTPRAYDQDRSQATSP